MSYFSSPFPAYSSSNATIPWKGTHCCRQNGRKFYLLISSGISRSTSSTYYHTLASHARSEECKQGGTDSQISSRQVWSVNGHVWIALKVCQLRKGVLASTATGSKEGRLKRRKARVFPLYHIILSPMVGYYGCSNCMRSTLQRIHSMRLCKWRRTLYYVLCYGGNSCADEIPHCCFEAFGS